MPGRNSRFSSASRRRRRITSSPRSWRRRTAPGDVVIDTHGRGGWIARNAIAALRRVYSLESTALTRLLAEIVLRPPDLRHFDAGLSTVATHPRGDVELKRLIEQHFTTRCPTCGRPVVVHEYIWDAGADAPSRKVFRCSFCREQARGNEPRVAPVDDDDIELARKFDATAARASLKQRFPLLASGKALPDELLDLYTPRTLVALDEIVAQLDTQLKAPAVAAGLKLGLVHALLAASRLNGYPGRVAALRIRHGHVQQPTSKQWRERNPWLAFEEGCREVREFVTRVEASAASFQPRPGDDIETLIDGTANVVLRTGPAYVSGNEPMFWSRRAGPARAPRSALARQARAHPAAGALERGERQLRLSRHGHRSRSRGGRSVAARMGLWRATLERSWPRGDGAAPLSLGRQASARSRCKGGRSARPRRSVGTRCRCARRSRCRLSSQQRSAGGVG